MQKLSLRVLVEGALMVALAMALNYIPHTVGVSAIEVQFGLIPLGLFCLRRGTAAGLAAGLVWGLLDMILRGLPGGSVLNPLQGFLEYPVAFALIGLAGVVAGQFQHARKRREFGQEAAMIVIGILIGGVAKYFIHFIAGVVYWGSYAPKGQSPVLYSLIVNGGSAIASVAVGAVVLIILLKAAPQLFEVKRA